MLKLKAYAGGSGALSVHWCNTETDTSTSHDIKYKDVVDLMNIDDSISNYWPLFFPHRDGGDWMLVHPVERISDNQLKMDDRVYTYEPINDLHYQFTTECAIRGKIEMGSHSHPFVKPMIYFIENEKQIGESLKVKHKVSIKKERKMKYETPVAGNLHMHFAFLVKNGKRKLIAHSESISDLEDQVSKKKLTRNDTIMVVSGEPSGSM